MIITFVMRVIWRVILLLKPGMEHQKMMGDSMMARLKHLVVSHEDYKRFPYVDTVGKITIGIGYNLSDRGLPDSWINDQYNKDITYFYDQLTNDFNWFKDLDENRQIALIDMCFMGYKKFTGFKRMLAAMAVKDYHLASFEVLSSKWATQVKGRSDQIAKIILTGEI